MSAKSDKLDEATELALQWAIDTLKIATKPDESTYLKIQALKAQAAALVGQLKARVDPGGMRGGKSDRVGEVLAERLEKAKAPRPN